MVEAKLPPGFRFHPRDEELVCDYLMKKVTNCGSPLLIEVDLNKCEPWDIPGGSCSSSLPALMDSYITFDQTHQSHVDESQQVPCFSIFNQNQISNPIYTHMLSSSIMEPNVTATNTFKGLPNMALDPFSCDKKVLKAVLNQLSSMDSNLPSLKGSPSLGEGSSESYLSDVGMPNFWNHF
ncbi:hypothetical protein FH972_019439 [Carpinus fangiana]|uniref:NAC domain-containing protein n=1 Tax=Carpinus fangiana TaxID=176857 RepID=A0A5N6RTE7_9ROSI|nr:hypothetical protein FH972_019439 [Carpinus fangiana]